MSLRPRGLRLELRRSLAPISGSGDRGPGALTVSEAPRWNKGKCFCGLVFDDRDSFHEHLRVEHPDRLDPPGLSITCAYCGRVFSVRRLYRDHLKEAHPVQNYDLLTTRWRNGAFIRAPLEDINRPPRALRTRRQPRGNHGLDRIVDVGGGPGGGQEVLMVVCHCGWTGMSIHGRNVAMHELELHYRNDFRVICPHCAWRWEGQDREQAERTMAQHIGTAHPDTFPWGYS